MKTISEKDQKAGLNESHRRQKLRKKMAVARMDIFQEVMTPENLNKFKKLVEYCLEIPPQEYQREILDSVKAMTRIIDALTPDPPRNVSIEKHDHHSYIKPETRDGKVDLTGLDNVIDVDKIPGWDKF